MFKLTAITNLFMTAILALGLNLGCADDSVEPAPRDTDHSGGVQPAEAVDPALCGAACDVLFGACGNAEGDAQPTDPRVEAACRASCRDGLFDPDKLECIATTACGEPVDCTD